MPRKRLLSTPQQVDKLNRLSKMANQAAVSTDLVTRLGALCLHSGLIDFVVIQVARTAEQVVLKGQLAQGVEPTFQPHEDSYFYDNQISTRTILRGIEKLLPFRPADSKAAAEATRLNELANAFIQATHRFLNYRNAIFHHVGSPKKAFEDVADLCDKATSAFKELYAREEEFFDAIQPYTFSGRERQYFYGGQASPDLA